MRDVDADPVNNRLVALSVSVSDRFTVEQRSSLASYLRAGELALALEMIADWLSEDERPISSWERADAEYLATVFDNVARVMGPLALCPMRDPEAGP